MTLGCRDCCAQLSQFAEAAAPRQSVVHRAPLVLPLVVRGTCRVDCGRAGRLRQQRRFRKQFRRLSSLLVASRFCWFLWSRDGDSLPTNTALRCVRQLAHYHTPPVPLPPPPRGLQRSVGATLAKRVSCHTDIHVPRTLHLFRHVVRLQSPHHRRFGRARPEPQSEVLLGDRARHLGS